MNLNEVKNCILENRYRITEHADEEIHDDNLTFDDVFTAVLNGEIIEEYSADKPYPSCLIYGRNFKNEPIHSVWAYSSKTSAVVLITV